MPGGRFAGRRVALVDGCRTPFLRSGTGYADLMAYELGAMAVAGLLKKTRVPPESVDRLLFGTVLQEPRTSNVAREVGLAVGLPNTCPATTVTAACISSAVAIASAAEAITAGQAEVVIAGGVETLSDVPIRFKRPVRKRLIAAQKARGAADYFALLKGLAPADLLPDAPAIAEFSTGLTMGDNGELLAKRFGIGREAQDHWAMTSHHRAARATAEGLYRDQILPAYVPPDFTPVVSDNGVRADTSLDKLARLPPAFDKRFGTVTAGNSSFLTDGAAACLLMSEERAKELGCTPLAYLTAAALVAIDPVEELLLGPVFATPAALDAAGLALSEIDVWEVHEAFAAPVLAVVRLLADESYCQERLGRPALGSIDTARLNAWGGSLSVGHPFGATGARLVTTCARRLIHEGGRHGLVTACAAGALGHALVLERA
jgi:acetyl-CoA acyltransferase